MTLDLMTLSPLLNRAYLGWGFSWPLDENVPLFREQLRAQAGILVTFTQALDPTGRYGYRVDNVLVENPRLYNWWVLQWS